MAYGGVPHPLRMVHTRRSTTAGSGGAIRASSKDADGTGNRTRRGDDREDPLSGHHYVMPGGAVDATYLKALRTASNLGFKYGGSENDPVDRFPDGRGVAV